MTFGERVVEFSVRRYRLVAGLSVLAAAVLAFLAAAPSIWPGAIPGLTSIKVDTDPENMLSPQEPVRAFNTEMKKKMALHDMVVVGVTNDVNPDGVFNPSSLRRIWELTEYSKTLQWREGEEIVGVIEADLIAPSTVDNIEPGGEGEIKFEWLMRTPPDSLAAAVAVRDKAERVPFLADTVVSADGRAVAIYLPLTRKDLSHRVYTALNAQMPTLWAWAPLRAEIENSVADDKARLALVEIGRLAAFHADGRDAFETICKAVLADAAAGRASKAAGQVAVALDAAARTAAGGKYPAAALDAAIAKADASAQWKAAAAYFLESRINAETSAADLAGQARAFITSAAAALDADAANLKDLPDVVAGVMRQSAAFPGPDHFYITGLPVAEDTFGVEMFVQMAISAPVAMVVIFMLMLVFFRKLVLIISPMIVAMVSVIVTMGALIIAGYPIHIMSSMIPIFIMPIAVLDSIHIISEFFERYQATRDRRKTMIAVMHELFTPMLYTSLTSAAGFASLALTPIPPVQVFGMFVAFGIMVAWVLTVTFIPAFVMFIPERTLANFGVAYKEKHEEKTGLCPLPQLGRLAHLPAGPSPSWRWRPCSPSRPLRHQQININDNPIKWFVKSHPIRVADRVLNAHFGGTYMAYLALRPGDEVRRARLR